MKHRKVSYSNELNLESFFLLIKPDNDFYSDDFKKNQLFNNIDKLINLGFKNLEIKWSNNTQWLNFVSNIKTNFPKINLGSASIIDRKSIDDSINIGLKYSMMRFWDKELFNYAREKNYLLIPGIKKLEDLKEAINLKCKVIKIYPISSKDDSIEPANFKNIDFIAAGGLSIKDFKHYKSLGYKSIVIGDKGFKNQKLDPNIYQWLKNNN